MELILSLLPETIQHYTGKPVPLWMRRMHPECAKAVLVLEQDGGLVYNDIWRSAEVSLMAMQSKTGVQPPGFSAHGFGLSIDFAVEESLKRRGWTYEQFLDYMAGKGWHCHRRDRKRGSEDWHFNYFGYESAHYLSFIDPAHPVTWAKGVEQKMVELYGNQFALTDTEVQAALKQVHMYSGELDGDIGPISREAIKAFQRAWHLTPTGQPDFTFQRTLAFVTATKTLVPIPA